MHILVAEDERKINKLIVDTLREAHFTPDAVHTAKDAEFHLKTNSYDLAILDRNFEGENTEGLDLVEQLRKRDDQTPVLLLTGKGNLMDKVEGLASGADDYLVKPFHLPEMLARVHSLLRRNSDNNKQKNRELVAGDLTIDPLSYTAKLRNKTLKLNNKEFQLLKFLLLKIGDVVTRTELLEKVWGDTEARTLSNTIDVHIRRLRVQLGKLGKSIHTIRGVGYRFDI